MCSKAGVFSQTGDGYFSLVKLEKWREWERDRKIEKYIERERLVIGRERGE